MSKESQEPRTTITTNINFDKDVWDWLNTRVAELKKSKPNYSKKDLIQDLIRREMERNARSRGQ